MSELNNEQFKEIKEACLSSYQQGYREGFNDACEQPSKELVEWWHGRGLSDELLAKAGWLTITPRIWHHLHLLYRYNLKIDGCY